MTPPSLPTDPGHVGILGDNTFLGYGTRIDNNGLPAPNGAAGPTWRGIDEGVGEPGYFGPSDPLFPQSKTLPGVVNPLISPLQELDLE